MRTMAATFDETALPPSQADTVELPGRAVTFCDRRHARGFWMPTHTHEEAHAAFVLEGRIQTFTRQSTTTSDPATLLFVPRGETHATQYHDPVRALYITFHAPWWERFGPAGGALHEPREYEDGPPLALAKRLHKEFQSRDNLTPFMLEGLTLELLVAMSRSRPVTEEARAPRWLQNARDHLHSHPNEPLSIEALATEVGVHPGHLMRSFRRHFHCTMGEYVRRLRVRQARQMLTTGDSTLAEIAVELGFCDQSSFCKTFKRMTGLTPTEMRNAENVSHTQTMFP
ncbi:AraC family transcriptional regulator [Fimbriimonas ginsengisoli]|nr:AraC family transcriptional regulator [Fimbriimonas ginsengisoli]